MFFGGEREGIKWVLGSVCLSLAKFNSEKKSYMIKFPIFVDFSCVLVKRLLVDNRVHMAIIFECACYLLIF